MKSAEPERTSVWRRIGPTMTQQGDHPRNGVPAGEGSGVATTIPAGGANPRRNPGATTRVWRRKALAQSLAGSDPRNGVPAGEVLADGDGAELGRDTRSHAGGTGVLPMAAMGGETRRSRRRRPRFHQPVASSMNVDPAPSISTLVAPHDASAMPLHSPPCIICWDSHMARARGGPRACCDRDSLW